ncbi:unnamed protein product [Mucor circinelloides]
MAMEQSCQMEESSKKRSYDNDELTSQRKTIRSPAEEEFNLNGISRIKQYMGDLCLTPTIRLIQILLYPRASTPL